MTITIFALSVSGKMILYRMMILSLVAEQIFHLLIKHVLILKNLEQKNKDQ